MNAAAGGSSALPADCEFHRLVLSAKGFSGGIAGQPPNLIIAWCRSRHASADQATSSAMAQFSCRRPQVDAGNNLRALTGQLGCRETAKGFDAGQPAQMKRKILVSSQAKAISARAEAKENLKKPDCSAVGP